MARRSAEDAAVTRARILAAGREAFTDNGYARASTAGIAARAGVTEGALFHHFRTKQALFREVFIALETELDDFARAASREGEPMAAFLAGVRASLTFCSRPDFKRIVMLEGPMVLGDAEWRTLDSGLGLDTVTRGLRNIAGLDRLSKAQARPMAVLVFGAMNEMIFALARGQPDIDIEACLFQLERMIRALLAEDPTP